MTLQEFLYQEMFRRGMNQRQMAELLGMYVPQFNVYCTGKRVPTANTLARMARVLDVDYFVLMRMCGHIKEPVR